MEQKSKLRAALKVIDGGKGPPAKPVVALRADETPDRPRTPLTAEEVEELRVLADLNPS